jgi:hypothetical protein
MKWAAGLLILLGACRLNFEPLGEGGENDSDDDDGGDSDGGSGAELGPFGAPTQPNGLSSARSDQGPSLTADLLEIYFYSNRNCPSCYDVYVAKRATVNDPWGVPAELVELSNAAFDMAPEISPDGLTLWYASERESPAGGADIWVTTRPNRASAWATPMRETNLSTAGYDSDPALSDDGLTMTITSDGNGDVQGDILVSTRASVGAPWSVPVPLSELNTTVLESSASMRAGGHCVFIGREAGQFDIYVATRDSTTGPFDPPVLLDNINSPQLDFDAWVSSDLRTLFFASVRTGNMEIFEAKR